MKDYTPLWIIFATVVSLVCGANSLYWVLRPQEAQAEIVQPQVIKRRIIGEVPEYINKAGNSREYRLYHTWVEGSLAVYANGIRQKENTWGYLTNPPERILAFPHGTPAARQGSVNIIVDYEPK